MHLAESLMIPCITEKSPGFDLPRKTWCTLNRIRTSYGISKDSLFKWGENNPHSGTAALIDKLSGTLWKSVH